MNEAGDGHEGKEEKVKATHRPHLLRAAPDGLRRPYHPVSAPARRRRSRVPRAARWPAALLATGATVFGVGTVADVVYHALPGAGAAAVLGPLVGSEGERAHVVTLVGMVTIVAGLLLRGLVMMPRKQESAARSPPAPGDIHGFPEQREHHH